jgi:thiamine transporter ThiT
MTFKQPVKNRNDMFDISVAGPLTGMVASIIALVIGSQLTLTSDASMLPSLSLSILTQSALGGGIINLILGNILFVPQSSLAAEMTVPLHPIAIAGFFSLIVNSLALVPIGSTL